MLSGSLTHLDWDSNHFGVPTYRLKSHPENPSSIADSLSHAKSIGAKLVYLFIHGHSQPVSDDILSAYGGQLVDHRVEFRQRLNSRPILQSPILTRTGEALCIETYPQTAATEDLLELAVIAGNYSRFQSDSNIPRERFESLYRLWMNSPQGEKLRIWFLLPS